MITVYYDIVDEKHGKIVEYWRQEDRSDLITEKFTCIDEERIRFRYEFATGCKNFELIKVASSKKRKRK